MLRNAQIVRKIWLFSSWYTVAANTIIHTQNDIASKQANQVSFFQNHQCRQVHLLKYQSQKLPQFHKSNIPNHWAHQTTKKDRMNYKYCEKY